ncbi:hypothetical protein SEA_HITCHHIKER_20 [Microbacterium phage HitchHiker]
MEITEQEKQLIELLRTTLKLEKNQSFFDDLIGAITDALIENGYRKQDYSDHKGGLPIQDLTLRWADVLHDSESDEPEGETRVVTDFAHANLINSDMVDRLGSPVNGHQFSNHKLVLDIDYPVKVIESSPGKSHLYIDKPITWDELISIMMTLVTAGIVERNYAMASIRRGYTSVRVPWALKGTDVPEPPKPLERKRTRSPFDLEEFEMDS